MRRGGFAVAANASHRNALSVVGSRKLRLGRLDRVQRGRKLIGPELLAVSYLTVPLRLLSGRSTRCPEALRQQLDQIRRVRLIPQYQHAGGHQGVRQQGTYDSGGREWKCRRVKTSTRDFTVESPHAPPTISSRTKMSPRCKRLLRVKRPLPVLFNGELRESGNRCWKNNTLRRDIVSKANRIDKTVLIVIVVHSNSLFLRHEMHVWGNRGLPGGSFSVVEASVPAEYLADSKKDLYLETGSNIDANVRYLSRRPVERLR